MINFIIWIIVGALIGRVASINMQKNDRQGLMPDIIYCGHQQHNNASDIVYSSVAF